METDFSISSLKIRDNGLISTRQWHKDTLVKSQKVVLAWNKFNCFFSWQEMPVLFPHRILTLLHFARKCHQDIRGLADCQGLEGFHDIFSLVSTIRSFTTISIEVPTVGSLKFWPSALKAVRKKKDWSFLIIPITTACERFSFFSVPTNASVIIF